MTYHFIVGDLAAKPLREAFSDSEQDTVVVLHDILNVGPLLKEEGQSFSEMRSAFWQRVLADDKAFTPVTDMERMLEISKAMFEDENNRAVIWMAPLPADVCAYYWLLPYLSKHGSRLSIVNIAGLPFLNESGKLFFPKSIAELSAREVTKATKLARPASPSEIETDTYEWQLIKNENAGLRHLSGGKKLTGSGIDFYDEKLLRLCTPNFQKASKVVQAAIGKDNAIPTGDLFLIWRLREMGAAGSVHLQEGRAAKDLEVRLHGAETISSDEL